MSGYTAPYFFQRYTDARGLPLAGGSLKFTVAGSNVLKSIYLDYTALVQAQNPMPLDAGGLPIAQYYFDVGLYDVTLYDASGNVIYKWLAVTGFGGGSGTDSFTVKTNAPDTTPDYLFNKLVDSDSVTWETSNTGGNYQVKANVVSGIGDHKVLASNTDLTPGYLADKIKNSSSINLSIDANQIKADYIGDIGVLSTGGTFTGHVSFNDGLTAEYVDAQHINAYNGLAVLAGSTLVQDISGTSAIFNHLSVAGLFDSGLAGPGNGIVITDAAGNLSRVDGDPFKVKYSATDAIAGFLSNKVKAGTGISINTTTDGVNGIVMHINSNQPTGTFSYGKAITNIFTTTGTPQSLISGLVPLYEFGTFTIPADTSVAGDSYLLNINVPDATSAFNMNISFTYSGGGFTVSGISVPVGSSNVALTWIYSGVGVSPASNGFVTYTVNGQSYMNTVNMVYHAGVDSSEDMTFDVLVYTESVASTITVPYITLEKK